MSSNEWAAFDSAVELMAGIRARLQRGSTSSGATFTAEECELILGHLEAVVPPANRRPRSFSEEQLTIIPIARHCAELKKTQPLTAIQDTAKHFKCSEQTVRNAVKNALPRLTGRSFFQSK